MAGIPQIPFGTPHDNRLGSINLLYSLQISFCEGSPMTIHYEISGRVAVITIRRPPVNSLNHSTRQALLTALNRALDDRDADAIVIWGGPHVFSAGAVIEEFATGLDGLTYASPTLPAVVHALEAASKPVIAAIAGAC